MSQSWKKYGGLNRQDGLNHLTVNSITTDEFSLKYPYQGTFSISGDLFVSQNTEIGDDVTIGKNLSVDHNVNIREYLTMGTQYDRGSSYSNFLYSDISGIGLNVHNPKAALDIDSSFGSVLNVHSSAKSTRNILARNVDDEQIALQITEEDARIVFSHKDATYDIVCRPEQDQMLFNKKVIVGPDDTNDVFSALVVTSAENSAIPFVSSLYGNQSKMSVAAHERSYDISTNTALLLSNTQLQGWYMGGGAYPLDPSKQMGFMGWKDEEGVLNPSQIQVSGNYLTGERTTTGYNTFQPSSQHTLDINGPIKLTNEELRETLGVSQYLKSMSFSNSNPAYGIVSGAAEKVENKVCFHKVYITQNYGRTWTSTDISYIVSSTSGVGDYTKTILGSQVFDSNKGILAAKDQTTLHLFTSSNFGQTWTYHSYANFFATTNPSTITPYGFDLSHIIIIENDIEVNYLTMLSNGIKKDQNEGSVFTGQVTSIDGLPGSDYVYISTAGGKIGLFKLYRNNVTEYIQFQNYVSGINPSGRSYYDIVVDPQENYIAACGENIISIQTLPDGNWIDISFDIIPPPIFRGITIYDLTHAVAIGDKGEFYYARNDITMASSWTPVQSFMIEGMGNSTLLKDYNILSVHQSGSGNHYTFMCDISDSILTGGEGADYSLLGGRVLYGYFPNIWFPDDSPYILTLGGHVETNIENFKMFDKTVKTLYLAAEAENVYLDMGGVVHMNETIQNVSRNTNTYTDQLHFNNNNTETQNQNQGIYFDSMDASKPMITQNKLERIVNSQTLADTTNTVLVDGNLRIGGNLMLEGGSNIDLEVTASFPDGQSTDLEGTKQKTLSVNFKDLDTTEIDLKGAGFYIANYIESSNVTPVQRDGFMKISNQSVDKMSFRSIGHPSVVAIDFPNTQTFTSNRNSLMVLKQEVVPNLTSETNDNYYIRSSQCDNSIIDVSCAIQNVLDLSVNHDVHIGNDLVVNRDCVIVNNCRVEGTFTLTGESVIENSTSANGAFHILQTLTVDGDASFQDHVLFVNDVSMGMDLFVADHVGIGIPPSSSFGLSVSGDIDLLHSVTIGGDLSMINGDLFVSHQVGIGTNPRTDFDLVVADDVLFESKLVVADDATFQNSVDISSGLGIGKSADTNYALDIEVSRSGGPSDKKALHILEKGNGSSGANGYDGSIILEHENAGGYSSIVFPNTQDTSNYGTITYFDDATTNNSQADVKYTHLHGNGSNGTLGIMSLNDISDSNANYDNIVVRPSGHLILDTGIGPSDIGGYTVIMPNGGNVGIGTTTPSTNFDVSGNSAFHGTATFQSGAVSFHDNVSFLANSDVYITKNIGIGMQVPSGYTLACEGNVKFDSTLDVSSINCTVNTSLNNITVNTSALFKGNTKFEDSNGSSGNVEIEGNLTVQKNLYVMGGRTDITTTTAVVKDPILMLGSWSGSGGVTHDSYDRGIFFDHVLPSGSTNLTGFMGYDENLELFRFKKAMSSGADVSNNKVDTINNDQNGVHQEGTILARTFKSVSAANIDKILLSENGSNGQWGGITTRTNTQLYNVENSGFKHLFTSGGTKNGSSNLEADGTHIAYFDVSGLLCFKDTSLKQNLYTGDPTVSTIVVETPSGTTFPTDGSYKSNVLWGPFLNRPPLIPTLLVFNNGGQAAGTLTVTYADSVKIYGDDKHGNTVLIQEITLNIGSNNGLSYPLKTSEPYTNIEFQFKNDIKDTNIGGTFYVKHFTLSAYEYEAHVQGGLNVDGNARFKRGLIVDGITAMTTLGTNTSFGIGANKNHAVGNNANTCFGTSAGANIFNDRINNQGNANTAFGCQALMTAGNCYYNVAVGANALVSSTGSINTAVGANAGLNISTGTGNTGVGSSVLQGVTSGTWNCAIGAYAGYSDSLYSIKAITTGTYNTFLGNFTTTEVSDCNHSTAVGYGAHITKSDQIVLGRTDEAPDVYIPGNVGIGTTSPGYNLDLTYAGEILTGKIHLFNDQQTIAATANTLALFGKNANGGIGFYTTDTTTFSDAKMYIINNGNVGIGTTNPTATCKIVGDSGLTISPSGTTGIRTAVLRLGAQVTENADYYCAKITSTNNHSQNYLSDLRFYTYGGNANNGDPIEERMCITSSGNVGIGTTSPTTALTIRKAIDTGTATIGLYGKHASMIEFKSYYPGLDYHEEAVLSAIHSGVSAKNLPDYGLASNAGFMAFHVHDGSAMEEKLRIEKHGELVLPSAIGPKINLGYGIGFSIENLLLKYKVNENDRHGFFVDDYEVAKFSKNGAEFGTEITSVMIGYQVGHNNNGNGYDSTKQLNPTGSVIIGRHAGYATSSTNNVAVGMNALANSTKSGVGDNVAIGRSALTGATQDGNVAIGAYAGASITGYSPMGRSNVLIGYLSGYQNDGGQITGNNLITGRYNTLIGPYTHTTKSDCQYSTAIGYNARITKNHQIVLGKTSSTLPDVYIPGKLGIGTDSPSQKLDVVGNAEITGNVTVGTYGRKSDVFTVNGYTKYMGQSTDYAFIGLDESTANAGRLIISTHDDAGANEDICLMPGCQSNAFPTSGATVNGHVGIGTLNPDTLLHVAGDAKITGTISTGNIQLQTVKSDGGKALFLNDKAYNRQHIYDHDHATYPGQAYYDSDVHHFRKTNGGGGITVHIYGTLTIHGDANATSFNATSDYRVKENVQTISGEIYTVDNLRPVSYHLKDSKEPHIGFIAHELQEHVPTAVKGEKDGEEMQSVNYSELIPILVKEIQDLKKEVRMLKERIKEH